MTVVGEAVRDSLAGSVDDMARTAEVLVAKRPVTATRNCPHRVLGSDATFGLPGPAPFDRYEARVRILCMECGRAFSVRLDSARAPEEGLGVVFVIDPEENPRG